MTKHICFEKDSILVGTYIKSLIGREFLFSAIETCMFKTDLALAWILNISARLTGGQFVTAFRY